VRVHVHLPNTSRVSQSVADNHPLLPPPCLRTTPTGPGTRPKEFGFFLVLAIVSVVVSVLAATLIRKKAGPAQGGEGIEAGEEGNRTGAGAAAGAEDNDDDGDDADDDALLIPPSMSLELQDASTNINSNDATRSPLAAAGGDSGGLDSTHAREVGGPFALQCRHQIIADVSRFFCARDGGMGRAHAHCMPQCVRTAHHTSWVSARFSVRCLASISVCIGTHQHRPELDVWGWQLLQRVDFWLLFVSMALEDGAAVFFVNSLSSMHGALENSGQYESPPRPPSHAVCVCVCVRACACVRACGRLQSTCTLLPPFLPFFCTASHARSPSGQATHTPSLPTLVIVFALSNAAGRFSWGFASDVRALLLC
jgi:hypothetical protein